MIATDYIFGKKNKNFGINDLTATKIYPRAAKLSFTSPFAEQEIDHYKVFVNGVFIGNFDPQFLIYATDLLPDNNYSIKVTAVDKQGGSVESNPIQVETPSEIYSADTSAYYTRVFKEGGCIESLGNVELIYHTLSTLNLTASTAVWLSALGGILKNNSNQVFKLFNLGNENDATMTAAGANPSLFNINRLDFNNSAYGVVGHTLSYVPGYTLISKSKGTDLNSLHRYQKQNHNYIITPFSTGRSDLIFSQKPTITVTNGNAPVIATKAQANDGNSHIITSKFLEGDGYYSYFDSELADQYFTTAAAPYMLDYLVVGGFQHQGDFMGEPFVGSLFHLITIKKALSDTERLEIENLIR